MTSLLIWNFFTFLVVTESHPSYRIYISDLMRFARLERVVMLMTLMVEMNSIINSLSPMLRKFFIQFYRQHLVMISEFNV